jgi:hypothetical protein
MTDEAKIVLTIAETFAGLSWQWDLEGFGHAIAEAGAVPIGEHRDGDGWRQYGLGSQVVDVLVTNARVVRAEVTVAAFTDVDSLMLTEYDDKVDEFYELWRSTTIATEERLGPPVFQDGGAAPGFPEEEDAVWVALWPLPSGNLMLEQLHEDRELPFRLAVVVAPDTI